MSTIRCPNIDSLSALIDRLAIEISKASFFENQKRLEHAKANPNSDNIKKWDHLSREAIELRSAIKNKIDELFKEVIESGKYMYLNEPRTFSKAKDFVNLIEERYSIIGDLATTDELNTALENIFKEVY